VLGNYLMFILVDEFQSLDTTCLCGKFNRQPFTRFRCSVYFCCYRTIVNTTRIIIPIISSIPPRSRCIIECYARNLNLIHFDYALITRYSPHTHPVSTQSSRTVGTPRRYLRLGPRPPYVHRGRVTREPPSPWYA
jgi:hypothetical protein